MDTDVRHPHFDYVDGTATECYRSKAMGTHFVLRQSGEQVVALVSMPDGTLPEVHQEPFAWGDDVWDTLDAIHAQR